MTDDEIQYACCFCKETVGQEGHLLDPCSIVLVSNLNLKREAQKEQQFFCHFECFRNLINDDGILYIAEPDFPSIDGIVEDDDYLN